LKKRKETKTERPLSFVESVFAPKRAGFRNERSGRRAVGEEKVGTNRRQKSGREEERSARKLHKTNLYKNGKERGRGETLQTERTARRDKTGKKGKRRRANRRALIIF
jgi:hypothetical protein